MAETTFQPTSPAITEGSSQTPLPGGLLLDLYDRAMAAKSIVPEAGGTPDGLPFRLMRSGVAWAMGVTETDPTAIALGLFDLVGYDWGGSPDLSTRGLQISSTLDGPATFIVPYTFAVGPGSITVDLSVAQRVEGASAVVSIGYALVDGTLVPPVELQTLFGEDADGFAPYLITNPPPSVTTIDFHASPRLVSMTIPRSDTSNETRGFILVSVLTTCTQNSSDSADGPGNVLPVLLNGSRAATVDPNHLVFSANSGLGFDYYFGATAGTSGMKPHRVLHLFEAVDASPTGVDSWHTVLRITPSGAPFTDPDPSEGTYLVSPALPAWFLDGVAQGTDSFGFLIDLHPQANLEVFSVTVTEVPDPVRSSTIPLQPGEEATAQSMRILSDPAIGYEDGPFPVGLGYRVKGRFTGGALFDGVNCLEKHEAFPWVRFADTNTSLAPLDFRAIEGWNTVSMATTTFSTSPPRAWWLDNTSATESTVQVVHTIDGVDTPSHDQRFPLSYLDRPWSPVIDPSYDQLPPDPFVMVDSGIGSSVPMTGTHPAGLCDRFLNPGGISRQYFPSSLLYPTPGADAAGVVSNFVLGGCLPYEALRQTFEPDSYTFTTITRPFFGDTTEFLGPHTLSFVGGPPPDDSMVVWTITTGRTLQTTGTP